MNATHVRTYYIAASAVVAVLSFALSTYFVAPRLLRPRPCVEKAQQMGYLNAPSLECDHPSHAIVTDWHEGLDEKRPRTGVFICRCTDPGFAISLEGRVRDQDEELRHVHDMMRANEERVFQLEQAAKRASEKKP